MEPNLKGVHHDHIDGSSAMLDIIGDLYRLAERPFPFASATAWLEFMRDPSEDIVKRFATVTDVLQSAEALELAGYAYGRRRAEDGLQYVEAKFAPQLHLAGGLTLAQVTAAMHRGLKRAEREFGLLILPVVTIGRHASPEEGAAVARLALEYDGEVALDLACDEANHPPEKHLPAFRLTYGTKVRRDCHAGEWVSPEPAATYRERLLQNVRTAVYELKADGIGHAIPLVNDAELMAYVAGEGIRVSGCPLSNLTGGHIKDVRELGIDRLLDAGVIYTLNADDDLFMPPLPEVVTVCDAAYRFTEGQAQQLEENVWRGAFDERARR